MPKSIAVMRFPIESQSHKYNLIHFRFFIQYAKIAGVEIEMVKSDDNVFLSNDQLIFSCTIDGQQIIVDYADHSTKNWKKFYPGIPYYKFQTTRETSQDIIPLGPPMVGVKRIGTKGATMREYNHIRYHYNYQPGIKILCKQLPNGAAVERRNMVHQMLKDNFSDVDINANENQIDFWKAHEHCLAAVCVPGATNHMVDRGHIELIGLGVCTVSPRLSTLFPGRRELEAGKHYIQCADDYHNLVPILKDLKNNPDVCKTVGNEAHKFYEESYSPTYYWKWILENL